MKRFRRLRSDERLRSLVRETSIGVSSLIYPVFVEEGSGIKAPIDSMPGVFRYSPDRLGEVIGEASDSGIAGVLLFGIPKHKDALATSAYDENGVTQQAIRFIRNNYPELLVIADVCLCEYTDHGHCGVVHGSEILNDETLPLLARAAVSFAKAGADIIAPSDMMDGHIAALRHALDEAGFESIPIMGYSAKFASTFYGPFRDAADSAPAFGDRRAYQMDPANGKEALKEVELDIEEGADIVMVKPAMPYLDVLSQAKDLSFLPMAAYQVSGEYAMIRTAVDEGLLDERAIFESLICIKRAGAEIIITYFAPILKELLAKYQD